MCSITVSSSTTPAVATPANVSLPVAAGASTMAATAIVAVATADANPFGSKSIEMILTKNEGM